MKLQTIISLLLLALAIFGTALVYHLLPAIVPSHWNALGEVDGYVKRNTHVFLFLGLCAGLPLLLVYLPKLDPKYSNIELFEESYHWFITALTAFFVSIYGYTTIFALGYRFPIIYFIIPAMSALFFIIGLMLEKSKSNYTIGLRVPWTLHSDQNWELTHKFAAKSFQYGSFVLLSSLLLPAYSFAIFVGFLTIMVLVPVVYSYWLHRKGV